MRWQEIRRKGDDSGTSCWVDISSPKIDLGDGLYMHESTWVLTREAEWDIDIRVGVRDGRLVAESIKVTSNRFSGGPVTSQTLRELPLSLVMGYAVNGVFRSDRTTIQEWAAWPTKEDGEYVAKHGLDDTTLRIVARIYRVAYLIGDPPTKKVETLLGLPRSTAGRWVAAAREAGYLTGARGPGKAGG